MALREKTVLSKNPEAQENTAWSLDAFKKATKNVAFIGDSLSVGMTNETTWAEVGAKSQDVLKKIQENIQKGIALPKTLVVLIGTNDVASGVDPQMTIKNIQSIEKIARKNGSTFIPGLIPPMNRNEDTKQQKEAIAEKINTINAFIRGQYSSHIDYPSVLGKNNYDQDGVHMNNEGKTRMRIEALKKISGDINVGTPQEKSELSLIRTQINELRNTLQKTPEVDQKALTSSIEAKLKKLEGKQEIKNEVDVLKFEFEQTLIQESEFRKLKTKGNESVKKILKPRNSFSDVLTSDLLLSKKYGSDVFGMIMSDPKDPKRVLSINDIKQNDSFVANFGRKEGGDLNELLGAGDIFPPSVRQITINGVVGTRQEPPCAENPKCKRPGYYDKNGKYLVIYHGYNVSIGEVREVTPEEKLKAEAAANARLKKLRVQDIIENGGNVLCEDSYDQELLAEVAAEKKTMEERRLKYKNYRGAENIAIFKDTFKDVLSEVEQKMGIPQDELVWLLYKEDTQLRPDARPTKKNGELLSSAFWLGQIIDETWHTTTKNILPRYGYDSYFDRYNPADQIRASAAYFAHIKSIKNCSTWDEARVYYHTGPNFGPNNLDNSMKANPWIANKMQAPTVEEYIRVASEYYKKDNRYFQFNTPESLPIVAKITPDRLITEAKRYMGTQYVWGGDGMNGIDCSGLVLASLQNNGILDKKFDTTAAGLYGAATPKKPENTQAGDLVFLHSPTKGVTHVEIAIWPISNGKIPIIDASGSKNAGMVSVREQVIGSNVSVGTPPFYG